MIRILVLACAVALALVNCDGCDNNPTGDDDDIPIDTSNASMDSTILGRWHRYTSGGALQQQNFAYINADSVAVSGLPTLTGVVDDNPQFARTLTARNGQMYLDPACSECPNEYFYDYTLSAGGRVTLYLLQETTENTANPGASTAGVFILRRDIDTLTDVNLISDSLVGTWDRYDSTGTSRLEQNFLVVTADKIDYRGVIPWEGALDTVGTTGRTLVARNGQIWYDYHFSEYADYYVYDYAMFNNGSSMYFADQTDASYTNPSLSSEFIVHYLKKR